MRRNIANIAIVFLSICLCIVVAFFLRVKNNNQKEIISLKNDLIDVQTTLDTANSQITTLESEKAVLETSASEAQTSLDAANSQIAELISENESLQTTLNTANSQITTLESEKAVLETNVSEAQTSLNTANSQIAELISENESLQTTLDTANAQITTLESEKAVLETSASEAQTSLNTANSQIAELTSENESLQMTKDTLYNAAEELYCAQQYDAAKTIFESLGDYLDAAEKAKKCWYQMQGHPFVELFRNQSKESIREILGVPITLDDGSDAWTEIKFLNATGIMVVGYQPENPDVIESAMWLTVLDDASADELYLDILEFFTGKYQSEYIVAEGRVVCGVEDQVELNLQLFEWDEPGSTCVFLGWNSKVDITTD